MQKIRAFFEKSCACVRKIFRTIGTCIRWTVIGISFVSLAGILFIVSGGYSSAENYKLHHVHVEMDPALRIESVSASLTREDFRQIDCLTQALYFEAGNQGPMGMKAVADAIYNRMESGLFPDKACQVIHQGPIKDGKLVIDQCQFSYLCEKGKSLIMKDHDVANMAYTVAYNQYCYHKRGLMPDITDGAVNYHADYVSPKWKKYHVTKKIGNHIFYALNNGPPS